MQLYTAEDSRQCDQAIIAGGVSGFALMQRAAEKIFDVLTDLQDEIPRPVIVLAGTGNNGADGLLVAMLAHAAGQQVTVVSLKSLQMRSDDARQALASARAQQVSLQVYDETIDFNDSIVIDALYGTGFNRALSLDEQALITAINDADNTVLAVDVPSGLCANTGAVRDVAVKANKTLSFIVRKRGLFTASGPDHAGKRYFYDLVSSDADEKKRYKLALAELSVPVEVLALDALKIQIKPRAKDAHKGRFGHCVLIGGNYSMVGAIILAAEACLRIGVGLVTIVTRPSNQIAIQARLPEVMTAVTPNEIESALKRATSIAIGPGLGEDDWAKALLFKTLKTDEPLVVDASALNILAAEQTFKRKSPWILTPHPKEAARLLGLSASKDVQQDRFAAVAALVKKMDGVLVLKGCGSLVVEKENISLSPSGNAGMSVGGTGDVLTGVIAGLLAQGYSPFFSAQLGVEIHSSAGDDAAEKFGQIGLLPSELSPFIRELINT